MTERRKAIILGASSGIGLEVAKLLIADGWYLGLAARREEPLQALKATAPERIEVMPIDVTKPEAEKQLMQLIEKLGGIDLYFHASGIGKQNRTLESDIELQTMETNAVGFTRILPLLCRKGRRPYCCHHLHCWHQRTWPCSFLFCHQGFAGHLSTSFGATSPSTRPEYPLYRYSPRLCRYSLA